MLPRRIILEGRGFIKVDNSLPHLKYIKFPAGSIKNYLSGEAIAPIGVAPLVVTKKVRVEREGSDKPVHVDSDTNMLCLEFKWDINALLADPELFVKYYTYFETTPQDGSKASTVSDFMPFVDDGAYSDKFKKYLANAGQSDAEYLSEARKKKEAPEPEPEPVPDPDPMVDEPVDEIQASEELDGFTDENEDTSEADAFIEDNGSRVDVNVAEEYKFYLVFEYSEKYDHSNMIKNGSHSNGDGIVIDMLVAENHLTDPNVSISGRKLKKLSPGFNSELMGIISHNYKTITSTATSNATIDAQPEGEVEVNEVEVPSTTLDEEYPEGLEDELTGSPVADIEDDSIGVDNLQIDPFASGNMGNNRNRDYTARLSDPSGRASIVEPTIDSTTLKPKKDLEESESSFERFKSHGKVGV